MINQYHPQRHRIVNGRAIGTIAVGEIIYIGDRPTDQRRLRACNPWIVQAWLPRYVACAGKYVARGGHLAVVKSLRDGRTTLVSDWLLLASSDV